ncbi:unnamed protein product [Amoebophrya sp. A120]|nr:unnamed protein product [Amoebophrya sp. A120]|eukprot:GSA120T00018053001.1
MAPCAPAPATTSSSTWADSKSNDVQQLNFGPSATTSSTSSSIALSAYAASTTSSTSTSRSSTFANTTDPLRQNYSKYRSKYNTTLQVEQTTPPAASHPFSSWSSTSSSSSGKKMSMKSRYCVRMDTTIPKLLVKIAPEDASAFGIKNLGEVLLKKPNQSDATARVAVVNISNTVASSDILMSVKLADLLELDEEEQVDVEPVAAPPPPPSSSSSSGLNSGARGLFSSATTSTAGLFSSIPGTAATASVASGSSSSSSSSSSSRRKQNINTGAGGLLGSHNKTASSYSVRAAAATSAQVYQSSTSLSSRGFAGFPASSSSASPPPRSSPNSSPPQGAGGGAEEDEDDLFARGRPGDKTGDLMQHASALRSMLNEALSMNKSPGRSAVPGTTSSSGRFEFDNKFEDTATSGSSSRPRVFHTTRGSRKQGRDHLGGNASSDDDGVFSFLHSGYHKAKRLYTPTTGEAPKSTSLLDEATTSTRTSHATTSEYGSRSNTTARRRDYEVRTGRPDGGATAASTSTIARDQEKWRDGTPYATGVSSSPTSPSARGRGSRDLPAEADFPGFNSLHAATSSSGSATAGRATGGGGSSSSSSKARNQANLEPYLFPTAPAGPPPGSQSNKLFTSTSSTTETPRTNSPPGPRTGHVPGAGSYAGAKKAEQHGGRDSPIKKVLSSLNRASEFLDDRAVLSGGFGAGSMGQEYGSNSPHSSPPGGTQDANKGTRLHFFSGSSSTTSGSAGVRHSRKQELLEEFAHEQRLSSLNGIGASPFDRFSAARLGSSPVDGERIEAKLETDATRRKLASFRTTTHYSANHPAVQNYNLRHSSATPLGEDVGDPSILSRPNIRSVGAADAVQEPAVSAGYKKYIDESQGKDRRGGGGEENNSSGEGFRSDDEPALHHTDQSVDSLLRESARRQRESLQRLQQTNERIARARREMDGWLNRDKNGAAATSPSSTSPDHEHADAPDADDQSEKHSSRLRAGDLNSREPTRAAAHETSSNSSSCQRAKKNGKQKSIIKTQLRQVGIDLSSSSDSEGGGSSSSGSDSSSGGDVTNKTRKQRVGITGRRRGGSDKPSSAAAADGFRLLPGDRREDHDDHAHHDRGDDGLDLDLDDLAVKEILSRHRIPTSPSPSSGASPAMINHDAKRNESYRLPATTGLLTSRSASRGTSGLSQEEATVGPGRREEQLPNSYVYGRSKDGETSQVGRAEVDNDSRPHRPSSSEDADDVEGESDTEEWLLNYLRRVKSKEHRDATTSQEQAKDFYKKAAESTQQQFQEALFASSSSKVVPPRASRTSKGLDLIDDESPRCGETARGTADDVGMSTEAESKNEILKDSATAAGSETENKCKRDRKLNHETEHHDSGTRKGTRARSGSDSREVGEDEQDVSREELHDEQEDHDESMDKSDFLSAFRARLNKRAQELREEQGFAPSAQDERTSPENNRGRTDEEEQDPLIFTDNDEDEDDLPGFRPSSRSAWRASLHARNRADVAPEPLSSRIRAGQSESSSKRTVDEAVESESRRDKVDFSRPDWRIGARSGSSRSGAGATRKIKTSSSRAKRAGISTSGRSSSSNSSLSGMSEDDEGYGGLNLGNLMGTSNLEEQSPSATTEGDRAPSEEASPVPRRDFGFQEFLEEQRASSKEAAERESDDGGGPHGESKREHQSGSGKEDTATAKQQQAGSEDVSLSTAEPKKQDKTNASGTPLGEDLQHQADSGAKTAHQTTGFQSAAPSTAASGTSSSSSSSTSSPRCSRSGAQLHSTKTKQDHQQHTSGIDPALCQIVPARRSSVQEGDGHGQGNKKMQSLSLRLNAGENPVFLEYVSAKVEQFATADSLKSRSATLIPRQWRAMRRDSRLTLEASELGPQVAQEIGKWFTQEVSGRHVSYFLCDRAALLFTNRISSNKGMGGKGVTGGPLGAVCGGHSEQAQILYREIFSKSPKEAVRAAFAFFGFPEKKARRGDWSSYSVSEISLAYRKACLKAHREGGVELVRIQAMLELIRSFAYHRNGEDHAAATNSASSCGSKPGAARGSDSKKNNSGTSHKTGGGVDAEDEQDLDAMTEKANLQDNKNGKTSTAAPGAAEDAAAKEAVESKARTGLSDVVVSEEITRTSVEVEKLAKEAEGSYLEQLNKQFDEYILRQMRFKSEVIDEIARLHESAAYAILGVDINATDEEIKKAYRQTAMYCHPDKGGDKADFQELNNAYEKIMNQREEKKKNDYEVDEPGGAPKPQPSSSANDDGKGEKDKSKAASSPNAAAGDEDADGKDQPEKDPDQNPEEAGQAADLLTKVAKAADEASRFANTAAEFAQQVAEASKTARKASADPAQEGLTKSIAHSAIVLTLTVVKAVRVVGYASLDAASHALQASKCQSASTPGCAAAAAGAMSAGFEALNSASSCAQATEEAAGELQAAVGTDVCDSENLALAADKAAEAASVAANSAIAAAIAAAEAAKQTGKIAEEEAAARASSNKTGGEGEAGAENGAADADGSTNEKSEETENGKTPDEGTKDDKENPGKAGSPKANSAPVSPQEAEDPQERRVLQRVNNHKLLQRLNAEILGYQTNIKQFLASNRKLIPKVVPEEKHHIFELVTDYLVHARRKLGKFAQSNLSYVEMLNRLKDLPLLSPLFLPLNLAISVNPETRVLRMAAIFDTPLLQQMLDQYLFDYLKKSIFDTAPAQVQERVQKVRKKIFDEISNIVSVE